MSEVDWALRYAKKMVAVIEEQERRIKELIEKDAVNFIKSSRQDGLTDKEIAEELADVSLELLRDVNQWTDRIEANRAEIEKLRTEQKKILPKLKKARREAKASLIEQYGWREYELRHDIEGLNMKNRRLFHKIERNMMEIAVYEPYILQFDPAYAAAAAKQGYIVLKGEDGKPIALLPPDTEKVVLKV